MKFRRLTLTAALAVAALSLNTHVLAEQPTGNAPAVKAAGQLIKMELNATLQELNTAAQKEVITATVHFSPDIEPLTLMAKVEIKDIESEG